MIGNMLFNLIFTHYDFQIKFLDCVISRPPSTMYYLYTFLRGDSSILAKNII